jgi:hypothetical protein
MKLTKEIVKALAAGVGFKGESLNIIVAIVGAESAFDTDATNQNSDKTKSWDRGLVQINQRWHPEVSTKEAFCPYCSLVAAWIISKHGTDFTPWSTFKNGAYKRWMPDECDPV